MNTLQIPQKNIFIEYAASWDEISPEDAPYIGGLLYRLSKQWITIDQFRKLAVDRFIGHRNYKKPFKDPDVAADYWANEGRLADTVNFFFNITEHETEEGHTQERYEVIPKGTVNFVPKVKARGCTYYGPGDFLNEMTFVEFKDLLYNAGAFMESGDTAYLDIMMGIAFRRKRRFLFFKVRQPGFDGRERIKYVAGTAERLARKFRRVTLGTKYMFFQYFMGCMYILKTDNEGRGVMVDGQHCDTSLVFGKSRKSSEDEEPKDSVGLVGVIMALAESGVFGNMKETAGTEFWDVMIRLVQLEMQNKEMEARLKKK